MKNLNNVKRSQICIKHQLMTDNSRLIITKLVLENFKSYYGKKEIGPFHTRFSGIVGANGSGKSNVIDAMLFVFGYKARRMRQPKLKDLIHKSANYSDLKKARVEVHFGKVEDDSNLIEGTQFSFAREVYADNTSSYFIGDKKSSFAEITSLLRNDGIDLDHNRFLILQGEVELISQMKPKSTNQNQDGLLEYIEDIIGTSELIEPIQEKEKELADINVIRDAASSRMTLAMKERDNYKEAKEEAQQYLEWKNKQVLLQAKQMQFNKILCEEKLTEYKNDVLTTSSELNETKGEIEKLSSKEQEKNKEIKEHEKKLSGMNEEMNKLTKKYKEKKGILSDLENRKKNSEKTRNELVEEIENVKVTAKNNVVEIENLKKKIKEDKLLLEKNEGIIDEEKRKLDVLQESVKVITKQLQDDLVVAQGVLSEKSDILNQYTTEKQTFEDELRSIERNIEENERMRKQYSEKYDNIKKQIDEKKEILNKLSKYSASEGEEKLEQLEYIKKHIDSLYHKRRPIQSQYADLLNQRDTQTSNNKIAKELDKLKKDENITNLYGRLGSLGTIDDKYNVAISAAAGNRLENIVVQDTETAKYCLNFIKDRNLGRTVFIILDEIDHERSKVSFTAPKNSIRLFDIVKPNKPDFADAFYYALRDTLVCDDYDTASKVSRLDKNHPYRVVTLNGELIEPSGAVTGGGRTQVKGIMNTFDEQLFNKLKVDLDKIDKEIHECKQKEAELTKYINENDPQKRQIELKKTEMDLRDLEQMKVKMEEMETVKDLEEDMKRKKDIERDMKKLEPTLMKCSKDADEAHNAVLDIQKKISDAGGPEYKKQVKKVNDIENKIINGRKSIGQNESKIINLQDYIDNSDSLIEKLTSEKEASVTAIKELESQIISKEVERDEAKEKMDSFSKEVEMAAEKISDLRKELEEISSDKNDNVHLLKKIEARLNEIEQKIESVSENIEKWTKKFQNLNIDENDLAEFADLDPKDIDVQLVALEDKIKKCDPNISAIEEYNRRDEVYRREYETFTSIDKKRTEVQIKYEDLRTERVGKFTDGFNFISSNLKEIYQMLTLGGDAELEVIDINDPFSEGIEFSVRPPGKSWKKISNLSGGEKTLSSLSLVFSLHQFKPTPLYIMDEIDAALDFKNVSIIANYLKRRTTKAQFIVISLRNNMFELADNLIGIYKSNDCTKSIVYDQTIGSDNESTANESTEQVKQDRPVEVAS